MSALVRNTGFNILGKVVPVLLTLVFAPVYIRILGIEAWGLVGFHITLTTIFNILNFGLGTTANRELARAANSESDHLDKRELINSLEVIHVVLGIAVCVILILGAPFIAERWLGENTLSTESVIFSLRLMAIIFASQFLTIFYQNCLLGLERHFAVNLVNIIAAILRNVGAYLMLIHVLSSIEVFFLWQLGIGFAQMGGHRIILRRETSQGTDGARHFRVEIVKRIARFAVGMFGISVVTVCLMNVDKVVLSATIPLGEYGYYMLAASVSAIAGMLGAPVFATALPRLSHLVSKGDKQNTQETFHFLSQLLSLLVLPTVITVGMFTPELLRLWTGDELIVTNVTFPGRCLLAGSGVNALLAVPYALQLAHKWTNLAFIQNVVSLFVVVPAVYVISLEYGAKGVSVIWLLVNGSWFLITPHIMHRRLLLGEKARWYLNDILLPALAALAFVGTVHAIVDVGSFSSFAQIVTIGLTYSLSFVGVLLLCSKLRLEVLQAVNNRIKFCRSL